MWRSLCLLVGFALTAAAAELTNAPAVPPGWIFTTLATAPFPHPERAAGHTYKGQLYAAETHYRDNTVGLFVPPGFQPGPRVDFVVHFHGWFNHVAKVVTQYRLGEQFTASRRNAVLVVPQGPRDAPDSFGGRLEEPGAFGRFMADVLAALRTDPRFARAELGNIILSGHSGGYRVMSFIVAQGGLADRIREVWLFDALYGGTENFVAWQESTGGRLLDIYTDHGGTKEETENLMADLKRRGRPFLAATDTDAKPADLRAARIVFLHTDLAHDDVLAKRATFRLFLETSCLREIPAPRPRN